MSWRACLFPWNKIHCWFGFNGQWNFFKNHYIF